MTIDLFIWHRKIAIIGQLHSLKREAERDGPGAKEFGVGQLKALSFEHLGTIVQHLIQAYRDPPDTLPITHSFFGLLCRIYCMLYLNIY